MAVVRIYEVGTTLTPFDLGSGKFV